MKFLSSAIVFFFYNDVFDAVILADVLHNRKPIHSDLSISACVLQNVTCCQCKIKSKYYTYFLFHHGLSLLVFVWSR